MKNVYLLLLLTFLFSCTKDAIQEGKKENDIRSYTPYIPENPTIVTFDYTELDTGRIEEPGKDFIFEFPFTNTGEHPLIINNCKGSAGPCEWPKIPILPNEKGMIKGILHTKGRRGPQSKSLTLNANTIPANTVLKMKAYIHPEYGAFQFDHVHYDLGKIKQNEQVEVEYSFTNIGAYPLVINTCYSREDSWPGGEINLKWTKETIFPEEKGVLKVIFNPLKTNGYQNKFISIFANTDSYDLLSFSFESIISDTTTQNTHKH